MTTEEMIKKIESYKQVLRAIKISDPDFPEILIENPEILSMSTPTEADIQWAKNEIKNS